MESNFRVIVSCLIDVDGLQLLFTNLVYAPALSSIEFVLDSKMNLTDLCALHCHFTMFLSLLVLSFFHVSNLYFSQFNNKLKYQIIIFIFLSKFTSFHKFISKNNFKLAKLFIII